MSSGSNAVRLPSHLPTLDGVRGLAVIVVIVHNAGWVAGESQFFLTKLFAAATASGWTGVQLFFVLSGFLITGILLDSRGRPGYFRSFFLRRTLRIFPLYYVFVALAVLAALTIAWDPVWAADAIHQQWPYWLYISNWTQPFDIGVHGMTHLWSLAVEEQFYLLWPIVVWWTGRRRLAVLTTVMILLGPAIRYWIRWVDLPFDAAYMFTVARWDALAAGALLAALLREESGRARVFAWWPWLAGVTVVALAAFLVWHRGFHSAAIPVQVIGQSLITILSTCLVIAAIDNGPRAWRWLQSVLSWQPLRTLGKYSYAMYVFHFPIHHTLNPFLGQWVLGADDDMLRLVRVFAYLALVLTLTLLAALISWRLIEQPFLELKERLAPRVV